MSDSKDNSTRNPLSSFDCENTGKKSLLETQLERNELIYVLTCFLLIIFIIPAAVTILLSLASSAVYLFALSIVIAGSFHAVLSSIDLRFLLASLLSGTAIGSAVLVLQIASKSEILLFVACPLGLLFSFPVAHLLSRKLENEKAPSTKQVFVCYLSQMIVFIQLLVCLSFSLLFNDIPFYLQVGLCCLYPIVVGICKTLAVTVCNWSGVPIQEHMEFESVMFAAMPYRLIYTALKGGWLTLALVLLVEVLYKAMVYLIRFHPSSKGRIHVVLDRVKAIWRAAAPSFGSHSSSLERQTEVKTLSVDLTAGDLAASVEGSSADQTLEKYTLGKFFYHQMCDFGLIIVVWILFYGSRLWKAPHFKRVSDMPSKDWDTLQYQFLVSLVLEVLLILALAILIPHAKLLILSGVNFVRINVVEYSLYSLCLILTLTYLIDNF